MLCLGAIAGSAQSQMTDEQVAVYVTNELSKGTSQQVIVRNLMGKGVNMTQLNRVRKNYLSRQNTMADLNSPLQKGIERNRKTMEKAEQVQASDNHQNQLRPVLPETAHTSLQIPSERSP